MTDLHGLPLLVATRPLETFGVGAVVVLCLAALGWAFFDRLRTPIAARGGERMLDLVVAFVVVVLAAAGFFEIADEIGLDASLGRFDSAVASELARSASPATLRTFAWITHLGDGEVQWTIGICVGVFLLVRRRRELAITWIAAVAGNGILNRVLKALYQRDRPLHEHGWAMAEGWSFPSGHASGALVVYGMLAYLLCRITPGRWRLPIALAATLIALAVGYSRVVLQVHYASDVLAGFLTGGAWLIVCIFAAQAVRKRYKGNG